MLNKITTLEEAKSQITKETTETLHLGALDIGNTDTPAYEIMQWLFDEILPPLKIFKWGDTLQMRKDKKMMGFNGLLNKSIPYHQFLQHGYSSLLMDGNHAGFGFQKNDEEVNITNSITNIRPSQKDDPVTKELLGSNYYHSAKAHWLTQSIIEEGLWAPIQGYSKKVNDLMQLVIHPGSVRSCVFEEMEQDDMELLIWDKSGQLSDLPSATFEEVLEYWGTKLEERNRHKNISFLLCRGVIEWQTDFAELGFRDQVFDFNKKIHELSAGKGLTIYIGYDSKMNDLEGVCETSIRETIKNSWFSGSGGELMHYEPIIKMLDISKLPDYNREYANQSTEFTYSRFLIPH